MTACPTSHQSTCESSTPYTWGIRQLRTCPRKKTRNRRRQLEFQSHKRLWGEKSTTEDLCTRGPARILIPMNDAAQIILTERTIRELTARLEALG